MGEDSAKTQRLSMEPAGGSVRLVAAIELGTTSVRMAIGQIDEKGGIRTVDSLQQAVSLGRDTFTRGLIEQETIEDCVKALKNFRAVLKEYRITDDRQIRAVATSAVREASNREAFLDRVYVATGLNVEVIDTTEMNRFTYLAVHPIVEAVPELKNSDLLVVEVGGGSTEALVLRQGLVEHADGYRLGSLRLRKTLEDQRSPVRRLREMMEVQVDRTVEQLNPKVPISGTLNMLALGGDTRFACAQLQPEWNKKDLTRLQLPALSKFTDKLLGMSVDEVVREFRIPYPDAETLGPALLACGRIAKALGLKQIFVGSVTLRDGILAEMAARGPWSEEFKKQIVKSALEIGRKYAFDQQHAEQVADMAQQLFRALQDEHALDPRYELILTIAALLHEIGSFVSGRSHHKHSQYLILNSDIFGLGPRDLAIASLVARYHRRALPSPTHEVYNTMNREDRVTVSKLAAILRVADALAKGYTRQKRSLRVAVEARQVVITVQEADDLTLEEHSLRQKKSLFEWVYGKQVVLLGSGGEAA